ncbi:MAG: CBS domain-containing protein [Proteobacteria bacterium]|nr:CBS domain-containing protein [Pseudomonadota bacterium]MBU1387038.1 CBS domain-containing protein [Pseudomonadota bacterium]MBU1542281.1 CBS domain-containing protein [Pseudomonadota bacterium]MBU2429614.1 CBS domain-containing protein [Pseudomonadota bacterium]MBU2479804.1 CBS domain-containing protein [Pseudomonadota bacterium]
MKFDAEAPPFFALSEEQKRQFLNTFVYEEIKKDQVVLEQDITRVEKFYILSKGCAQYFYETHHTRILTGTLHPDDSFGGLCLLFNDAVSIRTLVTAEDCVFMTVNADFFLWICKHNDSFTDYFAARFGRCMLNKSFAGIISRQIKDKEFNLPFFNRPIWSVFQPRLLTCSMDTSIKDAARKMSQNNTSAILVKKDKANFAGIVTDADLNKKAISRGMDLSLPVSDIMSSPITTISSDSQVFEAFLSMTENNRRHLAVHGQLGHITGIIRQRDLINAQTQATYLLIKKVKSARNIQELENIHSKLEKMLLDPIKNGANPEYITRLIATFSDAIIEKIILFSLETMGEPPCKFTFLTMGSEGREEQTLISDQDNAIVYEDHDPADTAKHYFDHLSQLICDQLNTAGYQFCAGKNMASNPQWCQPLSRWKEYFNSWIRTSNPENLLHSSIFFDFRPTFGDTALGNELKSYLMDAIGRWSGFLRNLAENTLHFKPPITRFGNFIVEKTGPQKDNLNIKLAMLPLIDFIRIYALKNGLPQTNTLTRLFRLYIRHSLTKEEHTNIVRAYNFLMRLRFLNQITAVMDENKTPDNFINPKNLSSLDQMLLKKVLKMMGDLQGKLSIEFTGRL